MLFHHSSFIIHHCFILSPRSYTIEVWSCITAAWSYAIEAWFPIIKAWSYTIKAWFPIIAAWSCAIEAWSYTIEAWFPITAAWSDIIEAWPYAIAACGKGRKVAYSPCPQNLGSGKHLALLCEAEGKKEEAEKHFQTAANMIQETGYLRRKEEAEKLGR